MLVHVIFCVMFAGIEPKSLVSRSCFSNNIILMTIASKKLGTSEIHSSERTFVRPEIGEGTKTNMVNDMGWRKSYLG